MLQHVTATLYCMEEYFRLGLNEDDAKGCTEKRQTWNIPKASKVDACPTNLVSLTKKVYGVEKRPAVYTVNKWDCRATSKRQVESADRRSKLRKRLLNIDQARKDTVTLSVASATYNMQRKKAIEAQTMVMSYGTSCFLQLLDDDPAPSSVTDNRMLLTRDERLARVEAQKLKFQKDMSTLLKQANCDHSYSASSISPEHHKVENKPPPLHVVRNFYEEHVCISPTEAIEIEAMTRKQSFSDLWHQERTFRISASIMKTVCHRKRDTDIKFFLTGKLCPKAINSAAINYGNINEDTAIRSYIDYQEKRGLQLTVHKCGLHINPSVPWLAATPDSIVEIGQDMGYLEVKCPYVCKTKPIAEAALQQFSFCLQSNNGMLQLKKKHQYFFQVQTQLFVTQLPWCNFVLWAPNDAVYVERIFCDDSFIEDAVSKARAFYFDKFLPSLLPYVIISDSCEDRFAVITTEVVQICDSAEVSDDVKIVNNSEACDDVEVKIVEASDDVEILSVSIVPSLTHIRMYCSSNIAESMKLVVMAIAYIMPLLIRLDILDILLVGTSLLESN
ncbi:uncharacterized protein [Dysidea avara]|uniref:uncharacterized protein isoform X1 n=1 Tax=Dysidea avara TaxID=196820 RepID=UPI00331E9777